MKPFALKLLSDENISPRFVRYLRDKGMDIIDVKEKGWFGKEDQFIIEQAFKTKRFVMTHDSDFGSLAINKGVPCYGIIYLKLKMFKIDYLVSIFDRFLSLDIEINPFSLVVIDESRIRIRLIEHLQNLN